MSAAPLLAHVADGSTQCAIRTSTALANYSKCMRMDLYRWLIHGRTGCKLCGEFQDFVHLLHEPSTQPTMYTTWWRWWGGGWWWVVAVVGRSGGGGGQWW